MLRHCTAQRGSRCNFAIAVSAKPREVPFSEGGRNRFLGSEKAPFLGSYLVQMKVFIPFSVVTVDVQLFGLRLEPLRDLGALRGFQSWIGGPQFLPIFGRSLAFQPSQLASRKSFSLQEAFRRIESKILFHRRNSTYRIEGVPNPPVVPQPWSGASQRKDQRACSDIPQPAKN
jgi:hypothetical protein